MNKLIGISFILWTTFRLNAFECSTFPELSGGINNDMTKTCEGGEKLIKQIGTDSLKNSVQKLNTDYEYTVSGLTVRYENNNPNTPEFAKQHTYVWDFSDGTKTTEKVLEYTYPTMGSYYTCLTIVENSSQKVVAKKCKNIEIIDENLCDVSWDPVCGCDNQTYMNACFAENYHGVYYWIPGPCLEIEHSLDCSFSYSTDDLTLQFINTSVGNYDSFGWDFGDGKTSRQRNPEYTYKQPGVYPVCLTIGSTITKKNLTFCRNIALSTDIEVPE
ncbi:MAG: PKD domain-containing protein [Sphingobacteriales bacterium]|nr:MAG: PKD domain-containing protein [Sphingobacteriales bacterium]